MFNIIVENVVDGKRLSNRLLQKFCYLRNPKVTENETYLGYCQKQDCYPQTWRQGLEKGKLASPDCSVYHGLA